MQINYYDYINSNIWRSRRESCLKDPYYGRPYECFICASKCDLQVHHLTYLRLGEEIDEDLCILCKNCHHLVHFKEGVHSNKQIARNVFELKEKRINLKPSQEKKKPKKITTPKGKTTKYTKRFPTLSQSCILSLYSLSKRAKKSSRRDHSIEHWLEKRGTKYTKVKGSSAAAKECFALMVSDLRVPKAFA